MADTQVRAYLSYFNAHDLLAIKNCLDIDCQVGLNDGTILVQGRDNMLKLYEDDFKNPNCFAKIIKFIGMKENEDETENVRMLLEFEGKDKDVRKQIDVDYVMRKNDFQMVKHIIHSVTNV
ncbi:unnamed protein product [Didymodactylos carnosus]|uniref:Uncharacterized protein n=1 Tax=Didymodactylos carnosus TaxID=1234261 RepID=A0A814YY84_9BILA|nr:unnamed protein product [Didymodactylos carnosus]CAF1592712.1 unnamed protein product [Didymodactylos carnosus]CAF3997985.1 unnamed protein product [Didymodactylos carnosus]CAF4397354.1 unnamed protein product [Didymodactylos carnosus]